MQTASAWKPTFQNVAGKSATLEPEEAARRAEYHAFRAVRHALDVVADTPLNHWALTAKRQRLRILKDAWAQALRKLPGGL